MGYMITNRNDNKVNNNRSSATDDNGALVAHTPKTSPDARGLIMTQDTDRGNSKRIVAYSANERVLRPIEKLVPVGFGSKVIMYSECLCCGDRYIADDCDELGLVSCDRCESSGEYYANYDKYNKSDHRVRVIVDWEQRTESNHNRSRYNFKKVLRRDGYTCQYCGYSPSYLIDIKPLSVDHIRAFSAGGGNSMTNLVCSCLDCNQLANNKWFDQFIDKKIHIVSERKRKGLPVGDRQWRVEEEKLTAINADTGGKQ